MVIQGKFHQMGKSITAEIPLLYSMISSNTKFESPNDCRKQLLETILETANGHHVGMEILSQNDTSFQLKVTDVDRFLPLILKRTRKAKKLSMGDVTKRLGYSSRNSYAQYEYGKTRMSFTKYLEIMQALDPERPMVMGPYLH